MTDHDQQPADDKKVQGEGDYAAAAKYDADQKAFVDQNQAAIPGLAEAAAEALDGPEGDELRRAEAEGKAHAAK